MTRAPTIKTVHDGDKSYTTLTIPYGSLDEALGTYLGVASVPPGFNRAYESGGYVLRGSIAGKHGEQLINDMPYAPNHPGSVSLECCEEDEEENEKSSAVRFIDSMQTTIDFEDVRTTLKRGDGILLSPNALYHSHILWSYFLGIRSCGDDKCKLSVKGLGSHLAISQKMRENRGMRNDLPGLEAPWLLNAWLLFHDSQWETIKSIDLERTEDDDFISSKEFTFEELRAMAVGNTFYVSMMFVIERSYFSLSSIIDLEKKPIVPEDTRRMVEAILRGEKLVGWDYRITGEGLKLGGLGKTFASDACVYYVHEEALTRTCPFLMSEIFGKESGDPVNDRTVRTTMDKAGVELAIRIVYGLEAPLPDPSDLDYLIVISHMFREHFIDEVVPQWERAICRKALAIDVRDPSSSSITSLLCLLNIIWQLEYGSVPVAKRVVIGVLADMIHLNTRTSVFQFVQDSVLPCFPDSGIKTEHVPSILKSLMMHLNMVSRVHKNAVRDFASGDGEEKERKEEEEEEEEKEENEEEEEKEEKGVKETRLDLESEDVNVDIPNEGRRSCTIS